MAKKTVASLKDKNAKSFAKVIRAVKTQGGGVSFKEEIVDVEHVKDALKKEG